MKLPPLRRGQALVDRQAAPPVPRATARAEGRRRGLNLSFGVDPGKKGIYFLGRSSYNRNPEPKKTIKVSSTPRPGSRWGLLPQRETQLPVRRLGCLSAMAQGVPESSRHGHSMVGHMMPELAQKPYYNQGTLFLGYFTRELRTQKTRQGKRVQLNYQDAGRSQGHFGG